MGDTRSIIWVDAAGGTTMTVVRTAAGGAAIETAALLASNAGRADSWEGTANGASGTPVAAAYAGIGDYALFTYLCADATIATIKLPAPLASLFMADGQTLDPANVDVIALNTVAIGALTSASGSLASSFLGGFRRRMSRDYP